MAAERADRGIGQREFAVQFRLRREPRDLDLGGLEVRALTPGEVEQFDQVCHLLARLNRACGSGLDSGGPAEKTAEARALKAVALASLDKTPFALAVAHAREGGFNLTDLAGLKSAPRGLQQAAVEVVYLGEQFNLLAYSERPVKSVLHRRAQQTCLVFDFEARALIAQLRGFATRGRLPDNLQFLEQTGAPILRVRGARSHPIVTERVQVGVELADIVRALDLCVRNIQLARRCRQIGAGAQRQRYSLRQRHLARVRCCRRNIRCADRRGMREQYRGDYDG